MEIIIVNASMITLFIIFSWLGAKYSHKIAWFLDISLTKIMGFRYLLPNSGLRVGTKFLMFPIITLVYIFLFVALSDFYTIFGHMHKSLMILTSIAINNAIFNVVILSMHGDAGSDTEEPKSQGSNFDASSWDSAVQRVGLISKDNLGNELRPQVVERKKDSIVVAKNGFTKKQITRKLEQISDFTNTKFGDITSHGNDCIEIGIVRHDIPDLVEMKFPDNKFYIGMDAYGWVETNPIDWPHLFIAGLTKYGKSNFMKYLAYSFIEKLNADVHIAAFKTPKDFAKFKGIKKCHVYKDVIEFTNFLRVLENHRVNVEEGIHKDDPIFVIIDEADLAIVSDSEDDSYNQKLVSHFIKTGRSANIHFIIGMQRVATTGSTVNTAIRDNMPCSISFPLKSQGDSKILYGDTIGFELERKRGRAIFMDHDGVVKTVQTPLFNDHLIDNIDV